MRKTRIDRSTPELDEAENTWWNTHAQTIEKVWAHSFEIQKLIRLPYLKKAERFFLENQKSALIWEVGCGSGWVGRLIAGPSLQIMGTDFSQGQIDLANDSAKKFNQEIFCKYILTDAKTEVNGHQGILISALLHHLSKEELKGFFETIQKQRVGTKVFLYEPTFIQSNHDHGKGIAWLAKQVIRVYRYLAHFIIRWSGSPNTDLQNKLDALFKNADNKEWFLSPKEVPFYEDELDQYLEPIFEIKNTFFVNYTELDLAQNLMLYQIEAPGFFISKIMIPVAIFLDKVFFSLNFRSVTKGQYFYKCFELVIKPKDNIHA